jgi:hypothetical protein
LHHSKLGHQFFEAFWGMICNMMALIVEFPCQLGEGWDIDDTEV